MHIIITILLYEEQYYHHLGIWICKGKFHEQATRMQSKPSQTGGGGIHLTKRSAIGSVLVQDDEARANTYTLPQLNNLTPLQL